MKTLDGIVVLEFCQYLAGPYAGLRLADLGARVIKIERPQGGDACRKLATKNLYLDGDSLVFHTINRNKESYAADLKKTADLDKVKRLIARADVMTHNFRPGVMEKIGLDWDSVHALNPRIVYGEVTGYGRKGPWADKPGQDLLAQSRSGLAWLSGSDSNQPVPFGLATADLMCGTHFAQGVLAALLRRKRTGRGARVEASLLESTIDLQFELFTTHFADDGRLPQRAAKGSAHAYLGAPYGVYRTREGWLALAMSRLATLAQHLECPALKHFAESDAFTKRDEIMAAIANHLRNRTTAEWLAILESADVWCAEILDHKQLFTHEGYRVLGMEQTVERPSGAKVVTTRCPIRIDGKRLYSRRAAPVLGAHNPVVEAELLSA